MGENAYLRPGEIAQATIDSGVAKASMPLQKQLLLAVLAGAFIALASHGASVAAHAFSSAGAARLAAGVVFPTGLMLVMLCGGELFTGNCLIVVSCLSGKIKWSRFARNLCAVYLGNFAGSLLIALLISGSAQLDLGAGALGGYMIKVATGKVGLSFIQALCSGALCNLLVCLAVWLGTAAKDIAGKIAAIFFPIFLFVVSGFEHCVANMYFIPAGLLALANPAYVEQAKSGYGVTDAAILGLNIQSFLARNMLPVTLGNLIGGVLFVGCAYYLAYVKADQA